ncbi:DUF1178 family protein [Magnetospirillum sp. UT-4]|uniref:DUF1178 family protein n=1 Tax=Magnetospirillum sp. UT-4 TaxID=2681467 RepID=UPI00137EC39A|nr:DUF1178 family protein [Magnetospirillum sp. UT-4]CAA7616923.1 conserved hypothetical protein [Magnetospirillum sp. UT-4]
MILFELRCGNDHHFEGWFRDNAAYEAQVAAAAVSCPVCGATDVAKAIMAPRLNRATGEALDLAAAAGAMRKVMGEIRKKVEESCDYVGENFAEEARKIHYGETEARAIYGEASPEQARELKEEGVEFHPVPWPATEN